MQFNSKSQQQKPERTSQLVSESRKQKMHQEIPKQTLYDKWIYDEVCICEAIFLLFLHSEHKSNSIEWNIIHLFHTDLKYFSCFSSCMLFLYYVKYKIIHFSRAFFPHHKYWQHSVSKQLTNINGFIILTFWYGELQLVQSLCTSSYEVERD